MEKKAFIIILLIMVSASCQKTGPRLTARPSVADTAVVTQSYINNGLICREHHPETGEVISVAFFDSSVSNCIPGIEVEAWICDGEITVDMDPMDPEDSLDCRKIHSSSELFGQTNPSYSCGNWGCWFWP